MGVDLGSSGYGLYQIIKVIPAEEKAIAEKRTASGQQFSQLQSQQDLNDYLDSVKERSEIKRNFSKLRVAAEAQ